VQTQVRGADGVEDQEKDVWRAGLGRRPVMDEPPLSHHPRRRGSRGAQDPGDLRANPRPDHQGGNQIEAGEKDQDEESPQPGQHTSGHVPGHADPAADDDQEDPDQRKSRPIERGDHPYCIAAHLGEVRTDQCSRDRPELGEAGDDPRPEGQRHN